MIVRLPKGDQERPLCLMKVILNMTNMKVSARNVRRVVKLTRRSSKLLGLGVTTARDGTTTNVLVSMLNLQKTITGAVLFARSKQHIKSSLAAHPHTHSTFICIITFFLYALYIAITHRLSLTHVVILPFFHLKITA